MNWEGFSLRHKMDWLVLTILLSILTLFVWLNLRAICWYVETFCNCGG
jgi:hypothetical protein